MSLESIQEIVGTAITDRQFLHDLLNSKRDQAIARFDLTPEERRVVADIQADTIEQFALQLDRWIEADDHEPIAVAPLPPTVLCVPLSRLPA